MSGPFKMKGFSGFGNSPMTNKSPAREDTRSLWQKAKDEGKQIWAGIKGARGNTLSDEIRRFGESYKEEEKKQAKERSQGKTLYCTNKIKLCQDHSN